MLSLAHILLRLNTFVAGIVTTSAVVALIFGSGLAAVAIPVFFTTTLDSA
jgi:hypothetical protein